METNQITIRASSLKPTDLVVVEKYGNTHKFEVLHVEFLKQQRPKKVRVLLSDETGAESRVDIPWDRRHQVIRHGGLERPGLGFSQPIVWSEDARGYHRAKYQDFVNLAFSWDNDSGCYFVEAEAVQKCFSESDPSCWFYDKQIRYQGNAHNVEEAQRKAVAMGEAVLNSWHCFKEASSEASSGGVARIEATPASTPVPAPPGSPRGIEDLIAEVREAFVARVRSILRTGA